MAKYIFTRPNGPWQYPTLGFTATVNDVIEANAAPDMWWELTDPGATVTLPAIPEIPGVVEPADGAIGVWNRQTNSVDFVTEVPDELLPARLAEEALANTIDAVVLGLVEVPNPGLAFVRTTMPTVYRAPNGRYVTDLDVNALKPAAGVTYYVSPSGISGNSGLTESLPTTPSAAYGKSDVGTIVFLAGEYFQNLAWFAKINKSIRIILRPGAILTSFRNPTTLTWALHSGNIYKANRTNTNLVLDKRAAYAVVSSDPRINGDAKVYEKVANVAAITKAGQWAYDATADATNPVFVWPLGDVNLVTDSSFMRLNVDTGNAVINVWGGVNVWIKSEGGWIEGGGQAAAGAIAVLTNGGTGGIPTVVIEDVVAKYTPGNGITVTGGALTVLIRSGVAHTYLDGFNYHSGTYSASTVIPDIIEIDCWSRDTGLYTTSETMNGTTAHDSIPILRINPDHADSFGPVIADDGGAKAWILGGSAKRSTATARKWCIAATATGSVQWVEGAEVDEQGVAALYADGTSAIHTRGIRAGSLLGASKALAGSGVIDTY